MVMEVEVVVVVAEVITNNRILKKLITLDAAATSFYLI